MTATIIPLPPPRRPSRSGEPWTEDDYETLVRLCLDGADLVTVAGALQRRDTAVLDRARRMLPLEERGLPADRALVQLRTHLREDPAYDWGAALTQSPPPRPVEQRVYTQQLTGLRGLEDAELLDVAELVVSRPPTEAPTVRRILAAVVDRRLATDLALRVGERMVVTAMESADLGTPVHGERSPEPWGVEPYNQSWGGVPEPGRW